MRKNCSEGFHWAGKQGSRPPWEQWPNVKTGEYQKAMWELP